MKDDTVSRRHAELIVSDTVCVCDLGSRNGTFVDDERIVRATVRIGQRLRFGDAPFLLAMVSSNNGDSNSEIETAKCALSVVPIKLAHDELSHAQRRVLDLILKGHREKQVATKLRISRTTVHNHIQAIYKIYGVHSRAELLVRLLTK